VTTHLHLVPRSRMRGAIPPLQPKTPSWPGIQLKKKRHGDNFTFCFYTHTYVRSFMKFTNSLSAKKKDGIISLVFLNIIICIGSVNYF
jgi:hypothetical protein